MKKIKILQVGASNIGKGGRSSIIFNLTQAMNENNFQNDFYLEYMIPDKVYRDEIEKKQGVAFIEPEFKSKKMLKLKHAMRFIRILKENDYDIVHINADYSLEFLRKAILCKLAGVKYCVAHAHNTGYVNKISKTKRKVIEISQCLIPCFADLTLACSTEAGLFMFGPKVMKKNKIRIIKNGVHYKKFKYDESIRNDTRLKLQLDNDFVVGHVGRFANQKNHMYIINIFNELLKKRSKSKLILVGEGENFNAVKLQAEQLHIEDNIIFLGNRTDVHKLLQSIDVFILPSLHEGLPVVAVEAQAAGLPVLLSANVSRETALISDVDFIGTEKKNIKDWVEHLLRYVDDEKRYSRSDEFLQSGFVIEDVARELENLYIQLMREKKSC